jgi:ribosomal protein S18 acetylase RimI-like enzyme
MEDFARAVGFSAALEDAIAAELRPWAGGTAVLEPGLPDTWDLNFLRLEEPWDGDPTAFVDTVGEAARAFGMRTPVVKVSHAGEAERLRPALAEAAYVRDGFVYMAVPKPSGEPPLAVEVRELSFEEARPHRREHLSVPWRSGEESRYPTLVDQLLDLEARAGTVLSDRWFAVADGDALVAMCRLLSRDGIGQVEDVSTLPEHRGRGHARAVIAAALVASNAAGHDLTFISAHEEDWPREFYGRLGFELVGTVSRFRRS